MELLEKRIAAEVTKSTAEAKGDYKPLVFLMTDGEPTDRWEAAADRLMRNRALQVVAIGCGPDTNLNTLRRITELVVCGEEASEETLAKFFKWVSASVATASQAVDATGSDAKLNLDKLPQDGDLKVVDESTPQPKIIPNRFVFLHCKCTKTKKFYLMKFEHTEAKSGGFFGRGSKNIYKVIGSFPLDDFEQSSTGAGVSVSTNQLAGIAAHCVCGKIHCCPEQRQKIFKLTCPWCGNMGDYGAAGGFNVGGGAG